MGVSSDAIFLYGIPLKEGELESTDEYGDVIYPEDEGEIGIEMHCSSDYTMYFVAVRSTITKASRGYPELIDVNKLAKQDMTKMRESLLKYVEKYELETDGEPGWWVFSYLG